MHIWNESLSEEIVEEEHFQKNNVKPQSFLNLKVENNLGGWFLVTFGIIFGDFFFWLNILNWKGPDFSKHGL